MGSRRTGSCWLRVLAACAVTLLSVTLMAAPMAAEDGGRSSSGRVGAIMFDVIVLRPLGFVQMVVGTGFFAIAGPMSLPSGNVEDAWDTFVGNPYEDVFENPLGRF